jgi:enoyl-CoA hydratase/carnithine racemase
MTQDIHMTQDIELSRDGAVMSAAFARPQKKNAITGAMYEALIEAFEAAERDDSVGAFMLSGKGGVFTAGNDLGDFVAAASRESGDFPAWRFTTRLAEFGKPLVAAVDGLAVGIGTTLLFHCDLVYATPESRFQTPFVNLGLVPEAGSSLLAPQRFGRAKAAELLLLAEPFDAGQAHALGLVNALVPRSDLIAHAMSKAAALAAKPRAALLATRRLMRGDGEALKKRAWPRRCTPSPRRSSPMRRAKLSRRSCRAGGSSRTGTSGASGTLGLTKLPRRELFIQAYDSQVAWPACYKSPKTRVE